MPNFTKNGFPNDTTVLGDIHPILQGLQQGVMIVSDGSYKETLQLGSAAWILVGNPSDLSIKVIERAPTPGPPDQQNPHRSELTGLRGAVVMMNDICTPYTIDHVRIQCGCDGEGTINTITSYMQLESNSGRHHGYNFKHFDLLSSFCRHLHKSPIKWELGHVKGHQNDFIELCDLDSMAQLNCMADHHAKAKLRELHLNDEDIPDIVPDEIPPV